MKRHRWAGAFGRTCDRCGLRRRGVGELVWGRYGGVSSCVEYSADEGASWTTHRPDCQARPEGDGPGGVSSPTRGPGQSPGASVAACGVCGLFHLDRCQGPQ